MKLESSGISLQPEIKPETLHDALDVLSGELLDIAATLNGAYATLCSYSAGELSKDWRKHAVMGGTQQALKLCLDRVLHLSEFADMDWHKLPPGKSRWAEIETQEKQKRAQP